MEKLITKCVEFNQSIVERIIELMDSKGVESKHNSNLVLKIEDEEQMHNIDGYPAESYVTEITPNGLISNFGHNYSHDTISVENLCLAIDSIGE